MSDPVSNVEIEDVLSSIRRLVSEENRPALRRSPKDIPQKPTRLVLTPSLLVPESEAGDRLDEPEQDSEDYLADSFTGTQQETDLDTDLHLDKPDTAYAGTEPEAEEIAAPDTGSEAEPDAEEPASQSDADTAQEEADAAQEMDSTEAEDYSAFRTEDGPDPQTTGTPWIDPDATLFDAAQTAEAPLSDPLEDDQDQAATDDSQSNDDPFAEDQDQADLQPQESGVADEPEQRASSSSDWWRPGTPEAEEPKQEMAADVQDAPAADSGENDEPADDVAWDTSADSADIEFDPDGDDALKVSTLSDKIAVLEAKIGQTQDQWEPDGETDDDYAGTPVETIEWQDHDAAVDQDAQADATQSEPEPEIQDAPAPDPSAPQDDDDMLDILPDGDTILDEESLRELVADIVRQELQGALGERITRNVRKLVRREIHRALTAQELD